MLIAIEGLDGAGKTTQATLLAERLSALGLRLSLLREPGSTALGEAIRSVVKHMPGISLHPKAELLLFLASRAQLVEEVIRPAISRGEIVICDRFESSSVAYQGFGRGLDISSVKEFTAFATGGINPDLTILLDISETAVPARTGEARGLTDRYDEQEVSFYRSIREGYLELAANQATGGRASWLVIDGTQSVEEVSDLIWVAVRPLVELGRDQ